LSVVNPSPDTSFVEHRSPVAAKPKSRRHKKNASISSKEQPASSDDQDKSSSTGSDDKAGSAEAGPFHQNPDKTNSSSLSSSLVSQEDEFLGGDFQVWFYQHLF
jgi:hypothetical protein